MKLVVLSVLFGAFEIFAFTPIDPEVALPEHGAIMTEVTPTESPTTTLLMEEKESNYGPDFQHSLRQYILQQRHALDNFENEISDDNLGPWIRSLNADFDSVETIYRNEYGLTSAKYKLMLNTEQSPHKFENLLFLAHEEAVRYCAENFENGTLLTLSSAHESSEVVSWLFHKLKIPAKIWLGAGRVRRIEAREGRYNRRMDPTSNPLFIWDDNSGLMEFSNWHTGTSSRCEPNDNAGNENCVEMLSKYYPYPVSCDIEAVPGNWNDIPCHNNVKNAVVCKKEII